jgi:alanine-glyoxylate transaminase/serine-glyoxylate transaminase/serine-pyruvate transaminase
MAGLARLGLKPFAQEGHRLWQLNSVLVPEGIDDAAVRSQLLRDYNIEISGGLGPIKGKVWRIGVMGYSAQRGNIRLLLSALEDILEEHGHPVEKGSAPHAAQAIYEECEAHRQRATAADGADSGAGETIGAESVAQGVAHKE